MQSQGENQPPKEKNQQKNDLALAENYRSLGLEPFPLVLGKKTPARGQRVRPIADLSTVKWAESNIGGLLGSYSSNAFALDFDSKSQYSKLLHSSEEIAYMAGYCPVVETGRGIHIIAKAGRPIQQSRSSEYLLDVKGQGGYVVLPNSLHNSGKIYRFLEGLERFNSIPNISDDMILRLSKSGIPIKFYRDFEASQEGIEAEFQVLSDRVLFGLPVYTTQAILEGESLHYSSRSEAECALVSQCIHRGLSDSEILTLFELYAGPKSKYKSKREIIRRRYLARTIENIQTRKYTDSLQRQEFLTLAEFWAGKGTCLAAVLSAFCSFSYVAGKSYLSCSIRDIALKAGISGTRTVRYATAKAEERGFIARVEKGLGWNASLWYINTLAMRQHAEERAETDLRTNNINKCQNSPYLHSTSESGLKANNINKSEKDPYLHSCVGHNLFRSSAGIGKNGMAILFLLSGLKANNINKSEKDPYLHSCSAAAIVSRLAISRSTVYEKLLQLHTLGLVESSSVQSLGTLKPTRVYCLAGELSIERLDEAAKKLGIEFTGQRQAELFEDEREAHHRRLAKLEHAPGKVKKPKDKKKQLQKKAVQELFELF